MPRPVKDDPRDCFKSFRFTEAEVTRLEARARTSGQTLSAYVRGKVLDPSERDGVNEGHPDPSISPARTVPGGASLPVREGPFRPMNHFATRMLADQLRRVGTNLNQIARRMNELRIPPPRDLTMLIDEIRVLVREARAP
jgi:hypothetical protein